MKPNAEELKKMNVAIRNVCGNGFEWNAGAFALMAGKAYIGGVNDDTANEAMWAMKAMKAALAVDHPYVKRYGIVLKKVLVRELLDSWNMAMSCIAYGDNTIEMLMSNKYMASEVLSAGSIRALCEVALSSVSEVKFGVFTDAESGSYNSVTLKDFNEDGGSK